MKNLAPFTTRFCCFLFSTLVHAQSPSFSWNIDWGNTEFEQAPRLATDSSGNVYCAGAFKGTLDFDPGPGDATLTSGFAGFGNDSYISKFDSSGTFLWVKQIGGASLARAILFDPKGFLYVAGEFNAVADFDPGPGIFNMTPDNNSSDAYLLKLDPNGLFIQATSVGGNGQEYLGCMALDTNDNIVIGGLFSGTSDFDPGPGEAIFTAGFLADLFIVKLDPDHNFVWAKEFSGNVQGDINGLRFDDDGNIYVAGVFDDIRDFDPGPDSVIMTAAGLWDIFVVKLNAAGEFQWLRHLGNAGGDNWAQDLYIDEERNLFVTGYFSGTLDFDPGPGELNFSATNTDPYIWKLTDDGDLLWAVQFAGISFDQSRSVTLDTHGNIYSTGWFGESMDFDPGPGQYILTSAGANDKDDVYIAKLNPAGEFIWAYALGGLGNDAGTESLLDPFGNIFITGYFEGLGAFAPQGPSPDTLLSAGSTDPFLVRWRQCLETTGEINAMSCDTYISPSGNHVWNTSGVYQDTLINLAGCDSILTINLAVVDLNLNVVVDQNFSLTAEQEGVVYQWLDCDNGFESIPEATEQTFFPVASGHYAVSLFDGMCEDTSACIEVLIVDVIEQTNTPAISIYPNPTSGPWIIDFGELFNDAEISVHDVNGRVVFAATHKDVNRIPMNINLSAGVYAVRVQTLYRNAILKLVVY